MRIEKNAKIFLQLKDRYASLTIQVRAAIWFLVCSFFQKGISAITTPIFTRLLSAEEYGQYNVFLSWEGILSVIVTFSLTSGVYMQGLVKYEEEREQFSSSLQGLTLTLVLLWFGIYWIFKDIINSLLSLSTTLVVLMFIIMWETAIFGFWSSYQRVDYKYKKLVLLTLILSVGQTALSLLFVWFSKDKVLGRVAGQTVVYVLLFSGLFLFQMCRGKQFFNWKFWKHALLFNLPLIPHYLSNTVLNSADRIMISRMVGDNEAGIYSLAYSISLLMTIFNTALQQTLEPWRYKKQKSGQQEDMAKVAYSTLVLIAVLNLILIALAPEIVAIFAPAEYYDAIWIIPLVSMSTYFMYMFGWFANFEFYYEKTKYIMIATATGAILNILLNYICIESFGYLAAGYTTLVCYIIYALMHYCFMRLICKKYLDNKKIYDEKILIGISLLFMLCGFVLQFTYMNQIIRYGILLGMMVVLILKRRFIYGIIEQLIGIRTSKKV